MALQLIMFLAFHTPLSAFPLARYGMPLSLSGLQVLQDERFFLWSPSQLTKAQ